MTKTNRERILDYLQSIAPARATNSDIREATGVEPHQQVYQITRDLMEVGRIQGTRRGRKWVFWSGQLSEDKEVRIANSRPPAESTQRPLNPYTFEDLARSVMSEHFGLPLTMGTVAGVPKEFDMVSPDGDYVGDAKYYTLVGGERLPPAKFSVIAEHVWLLEKSEAPVTFLVFGNERRVPELWLDRYGNLVSDVDFYFLTDDGSLESLTGTHTVSTEEIEQ